MMFFALNFSFYFLSVFNAEAIIQYGGLLIIFLAVYAQTGLFFCFFIPSGAFIFTGAVFIATGQLTNSLFSFCIYIIIACIAGCITSYWFGLKAGPLLYKRKDSKFFRLQHLRAAEAFYNKYGQWALTIGILFPIVRTFSPIIAGIIKMRFSRFILLVFIGSCIWVLPFIFAGYLIGNIPALKKYLPYIIAVIILSITIPVVTRIIKEFKKAGKENI